MSVKMDKSKMSLLVTSESTPPIIAISPEALTERISVMGRRRKMVSHLNFIWEA
jgi:hypothetical protein